VRGASNSPGYGVLGGPAVDGRSVVGLNLFNYQSSNSLMDLTVAAPTPRYNDPQGFFYTVAFSDGTYTQGQMLTLDKRPDSPTAVPEPASVVLLAIGGLFTLGTYRRRRASLIPVVCPARMV
jgi:hypothetical protein